MVKLTLLQLVALGQVRPGITGNVAVTSSAGGTRILPYDPMRTKVLVMNHESNAAFVHRTVNPTTNGGRRCDAVGGGFVDRVEVLGRQITGEYWAILATADGNLYVEEEVAYLLPGQELA